MPLRSKQPEHILAADARYGSVAIAFHWVMVVLVVVVGVLGLLHDAWSDATYQFWTDVHASVGLTVWVLVMARWGWRQSHRPPDLPPHLGEFARRWSHPVHLLLYLFMLVIPPFGIVTFIWHRKVTQDIHGYLAYCLFALIGLHVLAALWHQVIRRDQVLERMLPQRRASRGNADP
jgi:cytochrome b561